MNDYLPALSPAAMRWARFFGLFVALTLLGWLAMRLSAVLTPLVAAMAIAYILNPVVTWLERRARVPRLSSVTIGLVGLVLLGLALLFALTVQLYQFGQNVPDYVNSAQEWIDKTLPAVLDEPTRKQLAELGRNHGAAVAQFLLSTVSAWLSNVTYGVSLVVLMPMYTFFCLWRFNEIVEVIRGHLPQAYRPIVVRIVGTIDRAISDFFRGRLMVCLVVGLLSGIGWSVVGVRYGLVLGAVGGTLNLIPFMSGLVLPPTLVIAWLGATQAGENWFWPVGLAIAVYLVVQALESFVLSPFVDSRSTGLHPVTTVVSLLIGAELAGVLGMLLAIPFASTLKSLFGEFVLPEIRRLAGVELVAPERNPPPPPLELKRHE